jgi:hypothetical protein
MILRVLCFLRHGATFFIHRSCVHVLLCVKVLSSQAKHRGDRRQRRNLFKFIHLRTTGVYRPPRLPSGAVRELIQRKKAIFGGRRRTVRPHQHVAFSPT